MALSENKEFPNLQSTTSILPFPDAIKVRPPIGRFWEESVRMQLLQWIGESLGTSPLSKRVIDLDRDKDSNHNLRILEAHGKSAAYVTLSHCWINRVILTTTKSSLAAHSLAIPLSSLPLSFQQAVMICRWLGVQYLWIDSLCIVQDDLSDWDDQASNMGSIYENAFFTIAIHGHAGGDGSILPNPKEYEIPLPLPLLEKTIQARRVPVHNFLLPIGVVIGGTGR